MNVVSPRICVPSTSRRLSWLLRLVVCDRPVGYGRRYRPSRSLLPAFSLGEPLVRRYCLCTSCLCSSCIRACPCARDPRRSPSQKHKVGEVSVLLARVPQTQTKHNRVWGPQPLRKNAGSEGGESGRLQEKWRLAPGHTAQRAHFVRIAHAVSDTQHESVSRVLGRNDMYIRIAPQLAQTRRAGMRQRRR